MKKTFKSSPLCAGFVLPLCAALILCATPAAAQHYDITTTVTGSVYGNGDPDSTTAPGAATATNNSITVKNGGNVSVDAFGGIADVLAQGNKVTVESGGVVQKKLYGGYANSTNNSSTAIGNTATVMAGGESGNTYGGYAASITGPTTAQDNHVIVENNAVITGNILGGHANAKGSPTKNSGDALASGNTVTINGGRTDSNAFIYGATAYSKSGTALAKENTVTITGGDIRTISIIAGGNSSGGAAVENTVSISGGTFGDVYLYGGLSDGNNSAATGNAIVISGGTFGEATITGGHTMQSGNATGNSVTLSGSPYLVKTEIFGGDFNLNSIGDIFSGNTLNVRTPGLTVATIKNFEHLNFYLPSTLAASTTMLTVTKSAYLTENTDGTGRSSQVHVGIDGASSPLQIGDQLTLIDASNATGDGLVTGSGLNAASKGEGMAGVTLQYEFDVAADTSTGKLTATVTKVDVKEEQSKTLVEGIIGGFSLAAHGGDTVAGEAMANALSTTGGIGSIAGFGAASGGSMRLNSGSHVDMHSVSLVAGLAWGTDFAPGRLTLGGFFEYGTGSYDTYNSFSNAASIHGKGDTHYWGGGILGRMDFADTGPGHFFAEGSVRLGKLYNEYKNNDLRDSLGRRAEYDSDAVYYGLHVGTGYIWNITEAASLEVHGKYFWTRQESDSVRLSTGDPVSFKATDSHRLRGGTRFSYAVNDFISPYIGAAYEYEFDSKARATTNGKAIKSPTLRGGTGIGEIGFTFKPFHTLPLSFDLGAQGYTGKREGITGSLQAKLEF